MPAGFVGRVAVVHDLNLPNRDGLGDPGLLVFGSQLIRDLPRIVDPFGQPRLLRVMLQVPRPAGSQVVDRGDAPVEGRDGALNPACTARSSFASVEEISRLRRGRSGCDVERLASESRAISYWNSWVFSCTTAGLGATPGVERAAWMAFRLVPLSWRAASSASSVRRSASSCWRLQLEARQFGLLPPRGLR